MAKRQLLREEYSVGWVCALPIELAAAQVMLDEEHQYLGQDPNDTNLYTLGRIGEHNIVIACLPAGQIGISSAATVAMQMKLAFPSVRFGLMVGIGGGVPSEQADIRLGDVVVGQPHMGHGGVIQYDFGKATPSGFERTGFLNMPPAILLAAVAKIRATELIGKCSLSNHLSTLSNLPAFKRDNTEPDILFEASYKHVGGPTCESCNIDTALRRRPRESQGIVIHYGTIASGNLVIRDGITRDMVSSEFRGVLCFEMEAAGLINSFPCLVIRGISDYADSHKNKKWQAYAAGTAAAYAKELLLTIPTLEISAVPKIDDTMKGKADFDKYKIPFSLKGVPLLNKFVDRPSDIAELERNLLPRGPHCRRQIFVLRGLGGIGKTQLAVEFARRHQAIFSVVFWLDGRSESSLKQSIALSASRIPKGQIPETSRAYSISSNGNVDSTVGDVLDWLNKYRNSKWLLIFDNVDQEYGNRKMDGDSYDISRYFPEADHGSILITTRLARLQQLWGGWKLDKVEESQAHAMFEKWYGRAFARSESEELFQLLDGLPLALTQAASYMQLTGTSFTRYTEIYKSQWKDLMQYEETDLLQDYANRGIWTTWTISYNSVRAKNEGAANLLLLWAHLDNKDLWYGLLASALQRGTAATRLMPMWLHEVGNNELKFNDAIRLLRSYSMIEEMENLTGYSVHPVVHEWARQIQDEEQRAELAKLAVFVVGFAVPHRLENSYWVLQRRLLSHARRCSQSILAHAATVGNWRESGAAGTNFEEKPVIIQDAITRLGALYFDQGKLTDAEKMFVQALEGYEKALGLEHTSTFLAFNDLGRLYSCLGRLEEAEQMYQRALDGFEKVLGREHTSTLHTVNNLGLLYLYQGKLVEAEKMYHRAITGYEKALGSEHISTLETLGNLSILYMNRNMLAEAERILQRVLQGFKNALGLEHTLTLESVGNLGNLYVNQGRLEKAEEIYQRALQGFKKALGPEHSSTLLTVKNLGCVYIKQVKFAEAEEMFQQALQGYEKTLGPDHRLTLQMVSKLGILYHDQGKLAEAEKMYKRELQAHEKSLGPEHTSILKTMYNLGIVYVHQGKLMDAEEIYQRALQGYEKTLGPDDITTTLRVVSHLGFLYQYQGRHVKAERMFQRALQGYENSLGLEHLSTLYSIVCIGHVCMEQNKLAEAEEAYQRALRGYEKTLGLEHTLALDMVNHIGLLYRNQGKLAEAEKMYMRALQGYEKKLNLDNMQTESVVRGLGCTYSYYCDLQRRKRLVPEPKSSPKPTEAGELGSKMVGLTNLCERFGAMFPSLFGILGRVLIWEGQDDNAIIALEQQILLNYRGIVCDGCQKRLTGKRFVCKVCLDIDLCSECHENYKIEGILVKRSSEHCQAHGFIAVPREKDQGSIMASFPPSVSP